MDPLSDLLSLLKPESHMSAGFDAAGPWSVRFPDQGNSIKFGAVVKGACWLAVEGVAEPVLLEAGDSFLLPRGLPFRMASDLALPPQVASEVFAVARHGGIVTRNGGGELLLLSGRFTLRGRQAGMLLGLLPPILRIRGEAGQAALQDAVTRIMQELREPLPGGPLVIQHQAHMILLQAFRLHLAALGPGDAGWLAALADRQLSQALGALHAEPARRWTLEDLAMRAGMSRSSFAQKFKEVVGSPAMDYLARWRMLLAAERLAQGGETVASIALSLGYDSESAFSAAFKRVMGRSPRQYARDPAKASQPAPEPALARS